MNNNTDILEELRAISPLLAALKEKDGGIIVPEGYFNHLSDDLIRQVTSETPGILSHLPKQQVKVPEHYFESLADEVIFKIKMEEQEVAQGKVVPLQPSGKIHRIKQMLRFSAAACIIGFITFGIKNITQTGEITTSCEDGIACLTQEEIFQYIGSNTHDFDMQQIKEVVSPVIETQEPSLEEVESKDANQYIETNNNILDVDDASTDIF